MRTWTGLRLTEMGECSSCMSNHPFLDFTLEGFRCFRNQVEFRDPRHVNVVCGPNNSGKSTLLLPLRRLTTSWHPLPRPYHGGAILGGDAFTGIRFGPEDVNHESDRFRITFHRPPPDLISKEWCLEGRIAPNRSSVLLRVYDPPLISAESDRDNKNARHLLSETISKATGSIVYLPAARRIQPFLHEKELQEPVESIFTGNRILPMLLGYANSPVERTGYSEGRHPRLAEIETKMSSLMAQAVRIRPLPVEKDIELKIGDQHVALSRCGTGIEQLLVLSVALVEYPEALLLIEEPENFLHPTLQRQVMQQLLDREGESVVTTHSNHFLDIRDKEIAYYRTFLRSTEYMSAGVERIDTGRKYELIWDLGVRPSSLFESNATVWVEGPSDAIYLRTWLSLLPAAKGLVEGIHYTFAFHAGALLDKFFVDPSGGSEATDSKHIVDFFAIHPNFFIVADSDGNATTPIGHGYLQRLIDLPGIDAVSWVTYGKEVENYLPGWIFERWLNKKDAPVVREPKQEDLRWTPFWRTINDMADASVPKDCPNKVKFAEWATGELRSPTQGQSSLEVFDLSKQLERLVTFIRKAPGGHSQPVMSPVVGR